MSPEPWLERAHRALRSALLVLEDGDANGACSNAYYSMFYASRAALMHVGEYERALGKTHSGMVSSFSKYLVLPGLIAQRHSQAFAHELQQRIAADYGSAGVSAADAAAAIASAEAFVSAVTALVETRSAIDKPPLAE